MISKLSRRESKIFANLNILLEIIIIHLSFSNRKFFQNKKKKETQIAYLLSFENISSFKGVQLYDTIKSNKKKKNENNYSSRLKSSLLTRKKKKKSETITSIHRQGEYTNNMKNRTTERMNGLVLFLDREYISSNNRGTVLKIVSRNERLPRKRPRYFLGHRVTLHEITIRAVW